jgi:hypothetical protein
LRTRKKTTRSNPLKTSTPASELIDIHYEVLGVKRRWNRDRIERLCGYLKLSEAELASMVCATHQSFSGYITRNTFPGPVALLLTILETRYLTGKAPDIITNLFDFHGTPRRIEEDEHDARTIATGVHS